MATFKSNATQNQPRPDSAHASASPLVFLHEGLGCEAMWKAFPKALSTALGKHLTVLDRRGYGLDKQGDLGPEFYTPRFMHDEAQMLVAQLQDYGDKPILVGHSDGASIALLAASLAPEKIAALVVMSPHLFVEPITIAGITQARENASVLVPKLAKYHVNAERMFHRWVNAWLDPAFLSWNIEKDLAIECPVLAIQGTNDNYGTMEQLARLSKVCSQTKILELADCGHSPHLDQPAFCIEAITGFVDALNV